MALQHKLSLGDQLLEMVGRLSQSKERIDQAAARGDNSATRKALDETAELERERETLLAIDTATRKQKADAADLERKRIADESQAKKQDKAQEIDAKNRADADILDRAGREWCEAAERIRTRSGEKLSLGFQVNPRIFAKGGSWNRTFRAAGGDKFIACDKTGHVTPGVDTARKLLGLE